MSEIRHGIWTGNNDGFRTACGLVWRRGEPPVKVATLDGVTCPECVRTLHAAGISTNSERKS